MAAFMSVVSLFGVPAFLPPVLGEPLGFPRFLGCSTSEFIAISLAGLIANNQVAVNVLVVKSNRNVSLRARVISLP